MTQHVPNLIAAAITLILLGANLAFLLSVGLRLVAWFRLKIAAVMSLLVYVLLSFVYGDPSPFRLSVGGFALVLDVAALAYLWYSVGQAATHVGFIPLQTGGKVQVPIDKLNEIDENLRTIHTLVNSNMTAAMQAEFDAIVRELAMMREVVALKQTAGQEPSHDAVAAIKATEAKIDELRATLADRLKQTNLAEAQADAGEHSS